MAQRYKITLAYDGGAYVGWQSQRNGPSIQDTLAQAFETISGKFIRPQGSGRTDAGVHAVAQVAHVDLVWAHETEALQRALNSILPRDIQVRSLEVVPKTFHSQYSAKKKWYRYVVHMGGAHHAMPLLFGRAYCWDCQYPLKITAMRQAAVQLIGTHDFSSFQGRGASVKTAVRTLHKLTIKRAGLLEWPLFDAKSVGARHAVPLRNANSRKYIVFDFVGNGFLKQMVRNIMGLLVEVGQGKRNVEEVQRILQARDRKKAGLCAPPDGLYLMKVDY